MSRRESRGNLFVRVRNAVNSVEGRIPSGSGRSHRSLLHPINPDFARMMEDETHARLRLPTGDFGLSARWALAEHIQNRLADAFVDRTPFADPLDAEVMDDAEIRRRSCRRGAILENGMSFKSGPECPHNRNVRRDTVRRIRRLSREEQMLAGERLRREREDRQLQRRVREQAEHAEVIHVPDHVWDRWLKRNAA